MTDDVKRKGLVFLLLAVSGMILLASALPQLVLAPGIPLPAWESKPGPLSPNSAPDIVISVSTLGKALIAILMTAVFVLLTIQVVKGTPWREIPRYFREILGPFVFIGLPVLFGLALLFSLLNVHVTTEPAETELPTPLPKIAGPPLGAPPASFIWLAWVGLALLLVLLTISFIRWRAAGLRDRDPLQWEAEHAMQALRAGGDLRDIILRCYRQMSIQLKEEQGIELEAAMTAREFEHLAQARGIPHPPVHQLTLLFELARYADKPLTVRDEQDALDCLAAIAQYSAATKRERQNE